MEWQVSASWGVTEVYAFGRIFACLLSILLMCCSVRPYGCKIYSARDLGVTAATADGWGFRGLFHGSLSIKRKIRCKSH